MPEWVEVCSRDALREDVPHVVTVGTQVIGVRLWREQVFAVINRCGHAGAPMAYGEIHPAMSSAGPGEPVTVDATRPEIRCPWHHWGFDLASGVCTAPIRRPRLKTFQTRVEEGRVFVLA